MRDNNIIIFKHDVPELLDGLYNKYNNDGALELKIENIVITKDDKEYLTKTRKTKTMLGKIEIRNRTAKFIRAC